jgi:hypothetical protein
VPVVIGSGADLRNSKLRKTSKGAKLVRICAPTQRHCQQDSNTGKASDSFDPTRHPSPLPTYLRGRDEVSLGSRSPGGRGRLGRVKAGYGTGVDTPFVSKSTPFVSKFVLYVLPLVLWMYSTYFTLYSAHDVYSVCTLRTPRCAPKVHSEYRQSTLYSTRPMRVHSEYMAHFEVQSTQ